MSQVLRPLQIIQYRLKICVVQYHKKISKGTLHIEHFKSLLY